MAFKRSAVRSRLSPPRKETSDRMPLFILKSNGMQRAGTMGSCQQTTNGGGADAGHWHRRTRKINGACGRCISTTRILRVAFCSFDRQCAGMYTDVRSLCIAVKRQKVEVCDGRSETGEVRSFEQRRKRQLDC